MPYILKTRCFRNIYFLLALFICLSTNTQAQWSTNSIVNTAISTAAGEQSDAVIVSDGSGGAIITWLNNSSGIYAQHIDYAGVVQWTANGVTICTDGSGRYNPNIISDGSGGAIITWWDFKNGLPDIYAQRIDQSGTVQWTADGVAICNATGSQYFPTLVSDGSGGAIITWYDNRNGNLDIYSQRVNAAGTALWDANGVAISTASSDQELPTIVSDGAGGAIITWQDHRGSDLDIYTQLINPSGTVQWTADGVEICTAVNNQSYPKTVSDGSGGAIITWTDFRNNVMYSDIYAQAISSSGAPKWTSNGVVISAEAITQEYPSIASDGSGGAIIAWQDNRSGSQKIYIQGINTLGSVQWTSDGILLCNAANSQGGPSIVYDGYGGAIIAWQDTRTGGGYLDIYAQRVNTSGSPLWTIDGVAISTAQYDQSYNSISSQNIISDGSGGAIITWTDYRVAEIENADVYTQNICTNGTIGVAPPLPPSNVTPSANLSICSGISTSLSASGTGILGWYNASTGGTYLGTGTNYNTPTLTATTTYYVQDSICAANATRTAITVTVNSLPTVIVSPNVNLCTGQNTTLSAVGAINFVWSPVLGLSSSTGSSISSAPPPGVTSYTVTGTDVNGCSNNAVVEITMHNPQLLLSPNVSICSGELATLTCSGFDTYTWIPSTGLNASIGNNVQANLAPGTITYTVTGTFTLVAGCTNNAAVSVTQDSPIASITPNKTALCSGDSAILTGSGIADAYLWNTGETATTITVAPMTTRNYTLTLNKGNCSDTDILTINVTTQPTATITGELTICSGKRNVLSAISSVPGVTYLWSNETTNQGINVSPLISTSYSVVLSNGICKDTANAFISVTSTPTITLTANKTIVCAGENLIITGSASGGGTGTYLWNTGASTNIINTTPLSSQNFALTLSNFNCLDKDSIRITVIPMPTASISGPSTVCSGSSGSFTANGGESYLWNTGETTVSITKTPLSNTNYSVSLSNGNGLCIDTASRSITLITPIPTDAGPDITMAIGLDTVLSANNGTSWNWSPKGRLNCYTCQSTIASPLQTTSYNITVTDINGCVAVDSVTIFVIPCGELFIPGAFSPNNDGNNDVLYIRGTECIEKVSSFTIFNRWGEKIFETADIKNGWDGTRSEISNTGNVYIYFLDALSINGDAISKTGVVTLMK